MSMVNIALLQMAAAGKVHPAGNNQDANLAKGDAFCRRAAMMGADIALFPEMWNIGYTSFDEDEPGAQERWQAQAVARDSDFVMHFKALAEELEMAIAITYLEQWESAPRNAVSLIDRRGHILMTYAKVHTCDFNVMENACTPSMSVHWIPGVWR